MRKNLLISFCLCAALVLVSSALGTDAGQRTKGRFCMVGMGTAPDLITVRGVEVIKSADIVLVGSAEERELWIQYICGTTMRVRHPLLLERSRYNSRTLGRHP
jgi:hypothetical protein